MRPIQSVSEALYYASDTNLGLRKFFKSLEGHSLPAYLASNSYSFALPELATLRGS